MTSASSTRIVLYSLNYADRVLREVPYGRYLWERSLCYLEDLRQADKNLIIIIPAPIEPYVLKYHYRNLYGFDDRQVQSANERLTLLSPRSRISLPLDVLVLADDEIMRRLKEEARSGRRVSITNFAASPQALEIASAVGAALDEPSPQLSSRWGGKFGSREILSQSGIAMPRGDSRLLKDEASIVGAIRRLVSGDRPARQAIVKLEDPSWASAIGNALVDCERLVRTGDLQGSIKLLRQPWDDFTQEIIRGGAIVEEYIQDATSSPSGFGKVVSDNTVKVLATHDQILSSGEYEGCRFPAAEKWRAEITQAIFRVGHTLSKLGVIGTFGIDFIASASDGLLAVEVNLRKVGPSHVLNYVESLTGSSVDGNGTLRRNGSSVYYVHRRVFRPEILRGEHPQVLVERLQRANLLYDQETGEGAILHMLGALFECGYVELTSVATSEEMAAIISEAVLAVILRSRH
jgi:L-propargylglycine--L-glutamate ligase